MIAPERKRSYDLGDGSSAGRRAGTARRRKRSEHPASWHLGFNPQISLRRAVPALREAVLLPPPRHQLLRRRIHLQLPRIPPHLPLRRQLDGGVEAHLAADAEIG